MILAIFAGALCGVNGVPATIYVPRWTRQSRKGGQPKVKKRAQMLQFQQQKPRRSPKFLSREAFCCNVDPCEPQNNWGTGGWRGKLPSSPKPGFHCSPTFPLAYFWSPSIGCLWLQLQTNPRTGVCRHRSRRLKVSSFGSQWAKFVSSESLGFPRVAPSLCKDDHTASRFAAPKTESQKL